MKKFVGYLILGNYFNQNLYYLVCSLLALILFVITLIRAATTGITYDEAYTYINYASYFLGFLKVGTANNHPLNSLLIYLFSSLTGIYYNELIIRLPILLFYALFLGIAIKISTLFEKKFLVFSLLIFNYFLSEFFGLARGYGMAAALTLAGLYVYYQHRESDKHIIIAVYLFLLASASNFSMLVFVGCFGLYTTFFDIKLANLPTFIKRNYLHLIVQLVCAAGMSYVFIRVTGAGMPLYGSDQSFFKAIFMSYARMFTKYTSIRHIIVYAFILYFVSAIILLKAEILQKPFTVLLVLYFVTTIILAAISHRLLPTERILLPMWPTLAISIGEIYESLWLHFKDHKWAVIPNLAIHALSILLLVNFFASINLNSTRDWESSYSIRNQIYKNAILNRKITLNAPTPVETFYINKINYEFGIDLLRRK